MRIPTACAAVLASAMLAVGLLAQAPGAQTSEERPEACASGKQEIAASALPKSVDAEACRADGRPIVDGVVGALLPSPGTSVYVEALTTKGAQELEIRHLSDGTIELEHVGEESGEEADSGGSGDAGISSRAPGECKDTAYQSKDWRVEEVFRYRINWKTTPGELSRRSAIAAIRKGGTNITGTVNGCKMGDRVPVGISYEGYSAANAGVSSSLSCTRNDRLSVVSFGKLRDGIYGLTCTYSRLEPGLNRLINSDIKINSADFRWTTNPHARSCRDALDLEAAVTHERGHTFGLDHVGERAHRNLTMSPTINGRCQSSERSLGRGDVLGLDRKYP